MTRDDITERIVEHFSDRGGRADIWRTFELLLPTDRFLNIGYAGPYQSYLIGSPQQRLVEEAAKVLDEMGALDRPGRCIDLGCGRGGTIEWLAERHTVDVVGVDLVPYNIESAVSRTRDVRPSPSYVVGDVSQLPFVDTSFAAGLAIDTIVYLGHKSEVFAELARVLEPGGTCVVTDLLAVREGCPIDQTLDRFTMAWGMPDLWSFDAYRSAIESAGLRVRSFRELTPYSLARFRKWTKLFLSLADGPCRKCMTALLRWRGVNPEVVIQQVRAAHAALPCLRHVLVTIQRPAS